MRTDFSEVKSVFGSGVRLQNPKSGFRSLNPDFPIERNHNKTFPVSHHGDVIFCIASEPCDIVFIQESITWRVQLPYLAYATAFSQIKLYIASF